MSGYVAPPWTSWDGVNPERRNQEVIGRQPSCIICDFLQVTVSKLPEQMNSKFGNRWTWHSRY